MRCKKHQNLQANIFFLFFEIYFEYFLLIIGLEANKGDANYIEVERFLKSKVVISKMILCFRLN